MRPFLLLCFILLLVAMPYQSEAGKNQAEDIWEQADKASQAGKYREAIKLYERSLALCSPSELDCKGANLSGLGAAYDALEELKKAHHYYTESLKVSRQRNSPPDIALDLLNLGALLYKGMEQYNEALPLLQESLNIYRSIGKQEETSLLLGHMATIKTNQGRYKEAQALQKEALSISRRLNDKLRLADALTSTGYASNLIGAYDQADNYLKEAIGILRGLKEPDLLSTALNHKGLNDFDLSRIDLALNQIEEALAISQKTGNRQKASVYTNNLGLVQMKIGRYERSKGYYAKSLQIAKEIGSLGLQATALNNLGQVETSLGNYEASTSYYEESLKINRKLGRRNEIATNLNNIAMSHYNQGRYDEAIAIHKETLEIKRSLGNQADIAQTLSNIGAAYLFSGRLDEAERILLERRQMQSRMQGLRLRNPGLAETWLTKGKFSEALGLLEREPQGAMAGEPALAEYEMMLGRAMFGIGRLPEGSRHLLAAYEIIEKMRSVSADRGAFLRGGGAGGRYRIYHYLTAAAAERVLRGDTVDPRFNHYGKDLAAAAFRFSESTKARSLLERIAGQGNRSIAVSKLPPQLAEKERRIKERMEYNENGRDAALRAGGSRYARHIEEQRSISREMDEFVSLLASEQPLYAALNYPRPVAASDIPLADNELMLSYSVSEDATYLFLLRKGGVRKIIRIAVKRAELENLVKTFLEPMLSRKHGDFSVKMGADLYRLLLGEAMGYASPTDRLIIVPDGILGVLPFETLVTKEGKNLSDTIFMGDERTLTYYQSASLLALKRTMPKGRPSRQLFALGNPVFSGNAASPGVFRGLVASPKLVGQQEIEFPPLPETETEVRKIAGILNIPIRPPDILLGNNATEMELRKSPLGDYRFIHFATHASLPGLMKGIKEPFILLGQNNTGKGDDGFLTISEVLDMRLEAELVMLSACLTGVGKEIQGEGVANFARAFQSAGAQRVVVSLWEVASGPAVEYVSAYYAALAKGLGHSQAMKSARDIIRKKLPNPYYWGVFILHGEG